MQRSNTWTAPSARWAVVSPKSLLAFALAIISITLIANLPGDLSSAGKVSLGVFALTVIGWTLTKLNDTFVALFAACGLVVSRTISTENFFASLGNSVVWLMIGAFVVASALNKSGVSARLTSLATRSARNIGQLFYLLTGVLLVSALLIPSTSARAALMTPIYLTMASAFNDAKLNRALAILLPVIILQTAVASLVGAGAHLVINDVLAQLTGRALSFFQWLLMGLPFAAVSAFGTTWVILRLFLDKERRALPLNVHTLASLPRPGAWSREERFVTAVAAAMAVLWATETLHGLDNALVAVAGALAVTLPGVGPVKFKDATKGIEWEMIIFVAATLSLSEALVQSGAGKWLVDQLLVRSGVADLSSALLALSAIVIITLTSHLYIASRSARGAVIAPLTVLLAFTLGIDPVVLGFVTAAGVGYCITLVASAKPLAMFQQIGGGESAHTFAAADLIKLSALLAPAHVVLIVLFGLLYWPLFGAEPRLLAVAQMTSPSDVRARIETAPLAIGLPGLRRGGAFIEAPLMSQAGIASVGGQLTLRSSASCACAPPANGSSSALPAVVAPANADQPALSHGDGQVSDVHSPADPRPPAPNATAPAVPPTSTPQPPDDDDDLGDDD